MTRASFHTQARQHRITAGTDIEHDLARHAAGKRGTIGGETHRFSIHQPVEQLVIHLVSAQRRPELEA